jgi:hypothetical protein
MTETVENKPLCCWITKNLGRYNFASNAKDWCVQVMMPDGKVMSETWPEDQEPETEGVPPSEVIEMMVVRLKSYWLSTRREETLARVEEFRPQFPAMDAAWARAQIAMHERQIKTFSQYLIDPDA